MLILTYLVRVIAILSLSVNFSAHDNAHRIPFRYHFTTRPIHCNPLRIKRRTRTFRMFLTPRIAAHRYLPPSRIQIKHDKLPKLANCHTRQRARKRPSSEFTDSLNNQHLLRCNWPGRIRNTKPDFRYEWRTRKAQVNVRRYRQQQQPGSQDTPGGGVCATAREAVREQTARTTAQRERTRIFIR